MRKIIKTFGGTQKWHLVCGLIIFNDDSLPKQLTAASPLFLTFIYFIYIKALVVGGSECPGPPSDGLIVLVDF